MPWALLRATILIFLAASERGVIGEEPPGGGVRLKRILLYSLAVGLLSIVERWELVDHIIINSLLNSKILSFLK